MPIYTKKGDDGTTGLLGGKRIKKTDARIEALGTVDELNAALGICITFCTPELNDIKEKLLAVQDKLFSIGSNLARTHGVDMVLPNRPTPQDIETLEMHIDVFDQNTLTQLKNFILPGGHPLAAHLHLARAICRRAERRLFGLDANPIHQKYLNRLSDYLFTLARATNAISQTEETNWRA